MAGTKKIELFRDGAGEWRYRIKAANGRIVGMSEESFKRRAYLVKRLERDFPDLPIVELETPPQQ